MNTQETNLKTPVSLKYTLTKQSCDEISEQISAFCESRKIDSKDALRYRLSAEECILYWLEHGCEGHDIRLRMGYRMFTPFITLEAEGKPLDPYRGEEENFGSYSNNILSNLRLAPEYNYDGEYNQLHFLMRTKKPSQVMVIAMVIAVSVLVGVLGQVFMAESLRQTLLNGIIAPIYDTFFNILSCIAGPMIFLSVTWGIYGIGDAATLGRVGKRLIFRYLSMTIIAAACGTLCFPLFGISLAGASGLENQMSAIAELILSIFPSTIVEPFSSGNTLQIIFLAIVIGVAMLYLGQKTSAVARAIGQVNNLVQFLMELISRMVPFVIFLVVVNLIWSGDMAVLSSIWRMLLIYTGMIFITGAVFLLSVSIKHKVKPLVLLRKGSHTFLIALATASSAASFASNMSVCEKKYGISTSLCSFGIPLGMVMHKPISSIYNMVLLFYLASAYNISCSVTWIVLGIIVSTIVAVATPPIPGGGAIAYSILFAQMGIPMEAMAVALTIDMLTDFIITAFEMFCMPFSLIHSAYHLNMIDLDTLRS
ncbi:MAG: dicarboxylate/amino acid:cation symporter [Lachnospiraceae bacterium]|nr:dicarboxylate/amino acid:cation symporter [Lachnospiraceae bacterium]